MLRGREARWLPVAVGAMLAVACSPQSGGSQSAPSRNAATPSTVIASTTVPTFASPRVALDPIGRPAGATVPGTSEWYEAPAPHDHRVTLGVYRPTGGASARATLLLLNGADGFRRLYENLAERFTARGFLVVVGCWYDHPAAGRPLDAIVCERGPRWRGMNATSGRDLDALVAATDAVSGVDPARLVIVGHSYGAGIALLRAASGGAEPVVSSSGLLAWNPYGSAPLATDQFPLSVAASITVPVLLVHGDADGITPVGQTTAMVAALTAAGHPPTTRLYGAPAAHAFPWQSEAVDDEPGIAVSQRYVADVTAWIDAQYS